MSTRAQHVHPTGVNRVLMQPHWQKETDLGALTENCMVLADVLPCRRGDQPMSVTIAASGHEGSPPKVRGGCFFLCPWCGHVLTTVSPQ